MKFHIRNHHTRLMGVCFRYIRNNEDAKDVFQDGCIKIFITNTFNGTETEFIKWSYRVMANTCIDFIRKNNKFKHSVSLKNIENISNNNADIISQIRTQELTRLLGLLPKGYNKVFNMYAIQGYKHKEIATKMEITESTSKSQYRKAKIWLRRELELEK